MKIAIIHGYGLVNSQSDFYSLYLKNLEINLNMEQYDIIISSGGFTNKDIKKSEAQSLKEMLYDHVKYANQWVLEEKSVTTFENVKFCAKILEEYDNKNITVFCMNTHLPKIVYLSLKEYLKISKNETLKLIQDKLQNNELLKFDGDIMCEIGGIKFVGFDLGSPKKDFGKAIRSSIVETHYDDCPELHEEFVEIRKKLWGIK